VALIQAAAAAERVERVVFMLQREVAERVQARPGSRRFGILPGLVQARFAVEKVCDIGPKAFFPPPAVHSRVIRLWPLAEPPVDAELWPRYRLLLDRLFRERRKQLRTPLRKHYGLDDAALENLAAKEILDLSRRPETLSVEEMAHLAARLPQLPASNP
jgi:16S rRNA (adenine1518-N6/adenine1519-N6)-dimethyltransferase